MARGREAATKAADERVFLLTHLMRGIAACDEGAARVLGLRIRKEIEGWENPEDVANCLRYLCHVVPDASLRDDSYALEMFEWALGKGRRLPPGYWRRIAVADVCHCYCSRHLGLGDSEATLPFGERWREFLMDVLDVLSEGD